MLSLLGSPQRLCKGFSRREVLTIGALGLGSLALPDLLQRPGDLPMPSQGHRRDGLQVNCVAEESDQPKAARLVRGITSD